MEPEAYIVKAKILKKDLSLMQPAQQIKIQSCAVGESGGQTGSGGFIGGFKLKLSGQFPNLRFRDSQLL